MPDDPISQLIADCEKYAKQYEDPQNQASYETFADLYNCIVRLALIVQQMQAGSK